jgi:hypothetical protein
VLEVLNFGGSRMTLLEILSLMGQQSAQLSADLRMSVSVHFGL